MKITVKNFGPIREAKDIRISPLTMFVGPSNTGKSYLAVATYAAFKSISDTRRIFFAMLPEEPKARFSDMSPDVFVKEWTKGIRREWRNAVIYFLGEEGERIVKSRNLSVTVSSDDDTVIADLCQPQNSIIRGKRLNDMIDSEWPWFFANEFIASLGGIFRKGYYIPAIRGGVMQSYRAITDRSIQYASESDTAHTNTGPMFSGVLGRFVRRLIDINKAARGDKKIIAINKILESNILHGRINVNFSEFGLPDFRYAMKGKKNDMAINNVSASVAELAPLSVFMRYYLRPEDLLIFEEPETNLHPERQQDVADIMVRLVNAGVFVLATTHSDVVLGQIGNSYRASQFKDADKGKRLLGEDHEPLDKSKELAVYSFVESSKGTKVEKIDFGHMTGVMTDDHLDAARSLYNKTVRLVNGKNNE